MSLVCLWIVLALLSTRLVQGVCAGDFLPDGQTYLRSVQAAARVYLQQQVVPQLCQRLGQQWHELKQYCQAEAQLWHRELQSGWEVAQQPEGANDAGSLLALAVAAAQKQTQLLMLLLMEHL